MNSRAARVIVGCLLVLHGLGHAVLPLRGAGSEASTVASALSMTAYAIAMLGFVACGVAAIGASPFRRIPAWFVFIPAAMSLIAVLTLGAADLWPGVMLSVVLSIVTSLMAVPRAATKRWRTRVFSAITVGFLAYISAATLTWPWHRSWGVTEQEWAVSLPGDRNPRDQAMEVMHGVTIDAPPEAVWPWLVQIGQDRAGFYSYDWLERAFFVEVHNTFMVKPEWQQRQAGDFIRATQSTYLGGLLGDLGWTLDIVEPPHALVLRGWGAFVLQPVGDRQTRFLIRSTMSARDVPVWAAATTFAAFELPHFIMERRMMLTIKRLAERPPLE